MPTYDYACDACKHTFELFQSMTAGVKRKCPECGKNSLQRLIGRGAAVLFKGSGFYETDYRSDSYKTAASSDNKHSDSHNSEGKNSEGKNSEGKNSDGKPSEGKTPAAKSSEQKSATRSTTDKSGSSADRGAESKPRSEPTPAGPKKKNSKPSSD